MKSRKAKKVTVTVPPNYLVALGLATVRVVKCDPTCAACDNDEHGECDCPCSE